jgi:hypothetical protein
MSRDVDSIALILKTFRTILILEILLSDVSKLLKILSVANINFLLLFLYSYFLTVC